MPRFDSSRIYLARLGMCLQLRRPVTVAVDVADELMKLVVLTQQMLVTEQDGVD